MLDRNELLKVEDLTVEFPTRAGRLQAVDSLSFKLARGETLAILGESGSGKTMTGLALMRLIPSAGRIVSGRITFDGKDLLTMRPKAFQDLRGRRIAMVFQDPLSTLNPVFTLGAQIAEMFKIHGIKLSEAQARDRVIELLKQVRIPDPESRIDDYPHQLSGGMRQRATIAMGIALNPDILIADEPTTALDVTVQGQILDLLNDLKEERGMGLLLITHDFGVVASAAQQLIVMYAGRAVETGRVESVYANPAHPYTKGLMGAVPMLDRRADRLNPIPGLPAQLHALPSGCHFHPRCPYAEKVCADEEPGLHSLAHERASACHFAEEILSGELSHPRAAQR